MKLPTPNATNLVDVLAACASRRPSRHVDQRTLDGFTLASRFIAGARLRGLGPKVEAALVNFLNSPDDGHVELALNFMTSTQLAQAGVADLARDGRDADTVAALNAATAQAVFTGAIPWTDRWLGAHRLPGGFGFFRCYGRFAPLWFVDHLVDFYGHDADDVGEGARYVAQSLDAAEIQVIGQAIAARAAGGDAFWTAVSEVFAAPIDDDETFDSNDDDPGSETVDESGWFDDSPDDDEDDAEFGEPTQHG